MHGRLGFLTSFPCTSHSILSLHLLRGPCKCRPSRAPHTAPRATIMSPVVLSQGPESIITGPSWDLSDEYKSLDCPEIQSDIDMSMTSIKEMNMKSEVIIDNLESARTISLEEAKSLGILSSLSEITKLEWKCKVLLGNVSMYARYRKSVDGTNVEAKKLSARSSELSALLLQASQSAYMFLKECSEDVVQFYFGMSKETKDNEFLVRHSRKLRGHMLSLAEENMLSAYNVPGKDAWSSLYTDISSNLQVILENPDGSTRKVGMAATRRLQDSADENTRRSAWIGIKNAWLPHSETCAAILNAITAWRLESYKRRRFRGFLEAPLHMDRMSRNTLDALFEAIDANVEVGRRVLRLQAAALGKPRLDPWDLFAPSPSSGSSTTAGYTFDQGIDIIANAVGAIDVKAGEFVHMMKEKRWIEATHGGSKQPGAYCTTFKKSRTPRVYLPDYNGGTPLLITLAHELGHGYHSWVARDIPLPETVCPMSLSETASTFFEVVVGSDLLKRAKTIGEKYSIAWNIVRKGATFLLNIPARYKFECDLNERRAEGKLSKSEIDKMMVDAWKQYYGDALGRLDEVGIYSARTPHFYKSGVSFYNFVYSLGFLLSNRIYAERERVSGKVFADMYVNMLRDSGRMGVEEVVEKHIGEKIYEAEFWKRGIDIVRKQVDEFEELGRKLGYNVDS